MGSHPINLVFRFLLEVCVLVAVGFWGWYQGDGWLRFIFGFGLPILFAAIWGTFNVPNDPSRSGKAPIVTRGFIRLALELTIFALATWALYDVGSTKMSLTFGALVAVHYALSYDRIKWLLSK
jgi:hypothetical protein